MSATYTVEAVESTKDWSGKYGPMRSYLLKVTGHDNQVELAQKIDTSPPTVGQVIEGTLEPNGDYPPKLKKAQPPGGNFNGNRGGSKDFKADPTKQRAIAMESAIKAALDYCRLQHDRGRLPDDFTAEHVSPIARHFYSLILAAMQEAGE